MSPGLVLGFMAANGCCAPDAYKGVGNDKLYCNGLVIAKVGATGFAGTTSVVPAAAASGVSAATPAVHTLYLQLGLVQPPELRRVRRQIPAPALPSAA